MHMYVYVCVCPCVAVWDRDVWRTKPPVYLIFKMQLQCEECKKPFVVVGGVSGSFEASRPQNMKRTLISYKS